MDKLVEREAAARSPLTAAPSIAVQFFIIPLLVVGATVLVYVGFRSLLTEDRSAQEYLSDIVGGWVTVILGVVFAVCVLVFRRGIVGELAAWRFTNSK